VRRGRPATARSGPGNAARFRAGRRRAVAEVAVWGRPGVRLVVGRVGRGCWSRSGRAGPRPCDSSRGRRADRDDAAARRRELTTPHGRGHASGPLATASTTARSVAWCSASIWSAPDGTGLLTLEASSIQTDPDRSRRIVWMIKRMIKRQGAEILGHPDHGDRWWSGTRYSIWCRLSTATRLP
jgi:hypothetical protein